MIRLENKRLIVTIDEGNGCIGSLFDKSSNRDYIAAGKPGEPYRIEAGGELASGFESFGYSVEETKPGETRVALTWKVREGLTVTGVVAVRDDEEDIRFCCDVKNETDSTIAGVEFPIVPNLTAITEDGDGDYLAHSFGTGILIRNPMNNFEKDGNGLRHMPYPESFSGASMQFFAYYGENAGGLYFAAHDGEGYAKWLNFYKNGNDLLEASFYHGCEDMGAGKGMRTEYPVVIRALAGDGWYEAAAMYKEWAVRQFWCAKGELYDREEHERARWLHEEMGASTFGINASRDRAAWIHTYHDYIRTPIFHMLGPDWPKIDVKFGGDKPGGLEDWFPARFNEDNLNAMKRYGDKFAPFEFDYIFNFDRTDGQLAEQAKQIFPEPEAMKSIDKYKFRLLCPAHPYTHELHVRRDERLQEEAGVDSIYYDISANNIMKICMNEEHDHPVGAGRAITMAYRRNYIDTKAAMIRKAGRYVPMGTEMMCEVFLDVLDYYQSRAGGRPAAPLEFWNIRELATSGAARLIPMFAFVYHEYGALRMDGWGKLVEEIGELFYYSVARTYLWGGLYELNHEYSPMEALDGVENKSDEHYCPFGERGYAFSAERAAYVGMYAGLRTGAGNKYLAYGRMLKPLAYACERIALDWYHYNHGPNSADYNTSGTYEAESVIHSAWLFRGESAGLFFANVTGEAVSVQFEIDPRRLELDAAGEYRVLRIDKEKKREWFAIGPGEVRNADLSIPARSYALIEVCT
ncbi:DUF6259 domain-containing protein [Paenibacillus arenilitoris]|uniref:DUF6259 domain-containing protein n=1 Tax=Paenibacillus arenilitoris TaxID=2772299 RepID=A0A927CN34_9BACL|nr:DUF6259 domain-containing protein [Paenibacillus arenilitoris]MBD2870594.1 hypothetical protein [Paenibacillus arenilitoris]